MDSKQQPCIMCVIFFLDTVTGLLYIGDSVDLIYITTLCLEFHIRSKNVESKNAEKNTQIIIINSQIVKIYQGRS